jgi:PKD repeat protein
MFVMQPTGVPMKKMGVVGLLVFLLVVSVFIPIVVSGLASNASLVGSHSDHSISEPDYQYNSSRVFQKGVVFDDLSGVISVDPYVRDFAIGDLNGDGLKDVAVINKTNYICIYNRSTDGSLNPTPWRINKTGVVDMRGIAIGDLNNDGLNDIVVSYNDTNGDGHICIFYQSSQFSPALATLKNVSPEPWQVVIGKFDGTSNNSVATICMGSTQYSDDYIDIWRYPFGMASNDRDYFQVLNNKPPQFTKSKFLATGYVNNDTRADLVVGNDNGNNVYVALQPTAWKVLQWSTDTKLVSGSASDVQLADVMGNGRNDLVFADASDSGGYSKVLVYQNDGTNQYNGTGLQPNPQMALRTPLGLGTVAVGEFSNGPASDLLALSKGYANASAFMRESVAWFGQDPSFSFPVDLLPLKARVDRSITDNERLFILCQGPNNQNGALCWYAINHGLKGNANENHFTYPNSPTSLATGRLANGNIILASTSYSSDQLLLYETNGSISRTIAGLSGPITLAFGAFDLDGNDDLAVLNAGNHTVSLFRGSQLLTATQPFRTITLPFSDPKCLTTKSLRENSYDDLVIGYGGGGFILYNTENSLFFDISLNETIGKTIAGNRSAVCVGDFNNDSLSGDIALMNIATGEVEVYPRNLTGVPGDFFNNIPNAYLSAYPNGLQSMVAGDFGGSPKPDIAALTPNGKLIIFIQPDYGFKDTTFYPDPKYVISLGSKASSVATGDINDDGFADLLVGYSEVPRLSAYLRMNMTAFRDSFNFTTGAAPSGIIADDINGDGRADLEACSAGSRSLSFWFQRNLVPFANATASKYREYEGVSIGFSGNGSRDSYSDQASLSYYWTFNSTDSATGRSVTHSFLKSGVYRVSLEVTDRGGLSNWSNLTITILETYPVANFTWSPSSPIEGQPVSFIDLSSYPLDPIASWTWSFGDLSYSGNRNPTHTYAQWGHYIVTLTVVDVDGTINATSKGIDIADTRPAVSFMNSSSTVQEGGSITFTDTSVQRNDPILWRRWEFGDGGISNNVTSIAHKFNLSGLYRISLTVWDADRISNTTWQEIRVSDILPVVNFTYVPNNPMEGVPVNFTDTSAHYVLDPLVIWSWNFGDGNSSTIQNSSHVYTRDGNYTVTLTVQDSDGAIAQKAVQIIVHENSPIVLGLNATSGLTSFNEDQIIMFTVRAEPGWEPIGRYEWNFSFSADFVVDYVSPLNFTYHSFSQKGNYLIVVRVWDSDWYTEKRLWISIMNVAPTADFSNTTEGNGIVRFDASHSTDTPHDIPMLAYRWNFDDGTNWYPWSSDPTIVHTFSISREYNVTLEVGDDDGAVGTTTRKIAITVTPPDIVPPSVSNVTFVQTAVVGKPIIVSATLTDNSGQVTAFLYFRNGGKTNSTPMTRISGDVFEGQIPSQNSSGKIIFWIVAFDPNQNNLTTGEFEIVIEKPIPPEYWAAGFGGAVAILAGLFVGFRRVYATVDEAFIIYEDGRLIAHQTRHLKPGMDDEILSSMLVAIQDFVRDSFKDEGTTALKRLDFGDKKVLVEKGDRVYLAAVLHGKHPGKIPQKMLLVIEEIRRDFGAVFAEWDGDFESMRGVKDKTQPLFKKQWSITRIIRFRRSSEESGPLMIECPVCDNRIAADSKKCPSCGVDFSNASVDDLEQVAQDMLKDENSSSRKEENTEK